VQDAEEIQVSQVNAPRCLRQVQGPEETKASKAMVEPNPVLETHLRAAEGVVMDREVALEVAEGDLTLQLVATVAAAVDEDNSCPVDRYG
jgi:hypothetical protein